MANIVDGQIEWLKDESTGVPVGFKKKDGTEGGLVTAETNPLTGGIELSAGGEVIELGSNPDQLGYRASCSIGFAGDSIALAFGQNNSGYSPLSWAVTELYPCDYLVTLNTAVGGASSSHLISDQIATLEAMTIKPDVVVVQTLQNDYIGTTGHADGYFADLQQYSERALVAGVKLVVIGAHPPKSSSPDVASSICYLNRKIEEYCRVTAGNYFLDVFSVWRKTTAADTSGIAWRGTAFAADAFSDDGTHPTGLAGRAAAPLFVPFLQRYARPITPRPQVAVAYNNTTAIWNNLLGPNGLMLGTSGQYNAVNNANVPGNSAGAQDRWYLTDGNGILATPTIVTGDDGYLYQNLVLSGTASADATVSLRFDYIQDVASGTFVPEAIVDTISLQGVKSIEFACNGFSSIKLGVSTTSNQIIVGTKRLHFRGQPTVHSNSGFANKANTISITVENGATVSGSVRIGRVGVHRVA